MTKKDYKLIANAFAAVTEIHAHSDQYTKHIIRQVAKELAVDLLRDNPRFDRDKFFEACGLQ